MSKLTQQQASAVNGRGNLLVVAGAGTGKTHTLIARCLSLVVGDRVSLDNILMVTFTEAAAAEMRGRLRRELLQLHTAQPEDEWIGQQLGLLDTARISTLHGFCLQLAREHFHALGLDPQFSVLDETQTRPLQREALDELLEEHYAGADAGSLAVQALIRAVGRGNDKRIRKMILKLHAHAQSLPDPKGWLEAQRARFAATEPDEWRTLFVEAVTDLRSDWLEEIRSMSGHTAALRIGSDVLGKLPARPSLAEAAAVARNIAAADVADNWPHGTKRNYRDPVAGFFDDVEFLASLAPEPDGADPLAQDWALACGQMTVLLAMVREFGDDFARKKRDAGGVDFTDLEQCALQLLRDATVAGQWRTRLDHIFVDEYQDINAAQDAILTTLSRSGMEANRFLVGDVKQSIYRFRLANPGIFQRYHEVWNGSRESPADRTVDPGRAVSLTENFRSREALINFVNPLFASLMRRDVGGVDYEELKFGASNRRPNQEVKPDTKAPVEFHLIAKTDEVITDEDDGSEDESGSAAESPDLLAVEREARLVARRLRDLKESGEEIWDKDQERFRPVQWNDMAVLLRSPSGRAEAFAMEFSRAGVPLSAARDGFFASLEVSDLLNLLKLLDNPLQDVPLLAVLRSPLVAMTLEELAAVRAQGGVKQLFWTALVRTPKAESNPKVRVFLEQFARWRELVRQTSLSRCLETALTETHYESFLLAGARGPERVANVRRLLDLARQFDPFQRQGLYRFLRFVRLQEDEELDLEPASPPEGDAVRLISIHRSKGLEFPIVALPGLGTRFNEQDSNEPVLIDERLGLCPMISVPGSDQSYSGLTHWLARRRARRELRGEELRLLYVALTRARDRLVLVGTTNLKTQAARWESNGPQPVTTDEVEVARSHLDWLLIWLSRATTAEQWCDDRAGENELLHWNICDATDSVFSGATCPSVTEVKPVTLAAPTGSLEALRSRLNWNYPFATATTEAAKTSVTMLRRRAADETDDEAAKLFQPRHRPPSRATSALSPAEVGLAHHSFLQWVDLARTGNISDLRAEAERMQRAGIITPTHAGALDFKSLAVFWESTVGKQICGQLEKVKREMAFTARFHKTELDSLVHAGRKAVRSAGSAELAGDFIVVQGVADLVVLLPEEIWLLDFKTDQAGARDLTDKVKLYSPQLNIYALALARIYQRPVTQCWLHFLSIHTTVPVQFTDES